MVPSGSAFLLFAATTLDLASFDLPHQVFTHRHWDHEQNYRDSQTGNFGVRWITPTTLLDPSVAPPGEHAVVCKAITPYDIGRPWHEVKEACTKQLLDELDVVFPGFTDGLTFVESATPLTIERFSRNVRGAIHSWEQTIKQTEGKRPLPMTPVEGLYLCSQWTSIGGSFLRAFVSGTMVAQLVLEAAGLHDAVPDLRSAAQDPSPIG
jgi:phytoene dehydrogenase-like protein